jgi:capsular exopolysaccharide synthesis family protein
MSKIAKALELAKRMRSGEGESRAPAPTATPAPDPTTTPATLTAATPYAAFAHSANPGRSGDRRRVELGPPAYFPERRQPRAAGAQDRRQQDRRQVDIGPPPGILDRRHPDFRPAPVPDSPMEAFCDLISFVPERRTHLERNKIMTFCRDPRAMDVCNYIRTRVLEHTREKKLNTLLVTSVNPGEGKTLMAINLALSISREAKQTALLVEANLRRPAVAERLGLSSPCKGLTDYLFQDLEVSDLLLNPGLGSMLRVILGGEPSQGSTDMFSLPKMQLLVRELKARYDDRYIIFDGPHLKGMPDAHILASYVDGIILVVESQRTSRYDLAHALESLNNKTVVGIIMNRGPHF